MNIEKDINLIKKNVLEMIGEAELKEKLSSGAKLRVKFGVDPTSCDLHLGHSVVLQKLRQFQDMGHTVVLIIGDFTAQIGDPSGRDTTRPVLADDIVKRNAETCTQQAFKVLEKSRTEIRYNSEWLKGFMAGQDFINVSKNMTISRLLEREDFKSRLADQSPVSLLEILYPIFQGYDSVAIKADIELGGNDQIFNMLVGRAVQKIYSQTPQTVTTMPLLVGTDGVKKMSKSYCNYIGIADSASDIFGKVMSISDDLMYDYYKILTDENVEEIKALHPMKAKKKLASILVEKYHGKNEAEGALENFEKVFSKKEIPEDIQEFIVSKPEKLVDILLLVGICKGKNEARRLISQGAVKIDNEKIKEDFIFEPKECILQVGRRHFRKLRGS
ncbi:MAG: tyrosine--tRNA ligase [Elusimicrobia bacterium]|nr:tyrosine--tRNA ligase [Elusimicrobiota bacterium]